MSRRLPPLPALRSFESAARYLSFKAAAEDLHVTPSAVSHSIQNLEAFLGVKLFHREASGKRAAKALQLTDAGNAFLPAILKAFQGIERATNSVMAHGATDILTIGAAPIFARSWLMPRLSRYVEKHADTDIRIISTLEPLDLVQGQMDVGIMYGRGNWQGLKTELVLPEHMVPICSPKLLKDGKVLNSPNDLANFTLIHSEARLTSWAMWLDNAGVSGLNAQKGLHFNRAALAIEAALNGLGVVLEGKTAVRDHLARGDLIIPFEAEEMPNTGSGYYFTYIEGRKEIPKIKAFHDWIMAEIVAGS